MSKGVIAFSPKGTSVAFGKFQAKLPFLVEQKTAGRRDRIGYKDFENFEPCLKKSIERNPFLLDRHSKKAEVCCPSTHRDPLRYVSRKLCTIKKGQLMKQFLLPRAHNLQLL